MRDKHGLKCNEERVLNCLNITEPTMKAEEAKAWLKETQSVVHPISRIPVEDGYGCSLCFYSAKKKTVLYNHVSNVHRDAIKKGLIVERKVQKPFTSRLKQYIIVNSVDDDETQDIPHWRATLNEQFEETLNELTQSGYVASTDLRLVNTFIAKIR